MAIEHPANAHTALAKTFRCRRDLHTFNNPEVSFRAGAERLKRLAVRLAFVSHTALS